MLRFRPATSPSSIWIACLASLAWPFVVLAEQNPKSAPRRDTDAKPNAVAVADETPAGSSSARAIPFVKYRLSNGLEVILHQDATIPLVAVNLWYHVGPVNEPKGRSGFAHLFEHLMFEGSKHVGPNFDRLLESAGATNSNGTTSWDRTNYFETVPREHLELALWIESDRMGYLRDAITQERLDVQREVVKNERRQSYENAPYGPSTLKFLDTMFPVGHPYHGAVIGSMQDLAAATLADVREFADAYYVPSNATLTIAGDFDAAPTKAWIDKYFGGLRRVAKPSVPSVSQLPLPHAERIIVREPVDVAKIVLGWVAPPAYSPEHASLCVLTTVLADGKSSRLYRSLVVDERVASDVDAELDANALSTLVTVDVQVASGVAVDRVEKRLSQELDRAAQAPPSEQELERAKKRIQLQLASDLELLNGHGGESGRAGLLQRFNHYLGDPGAISGWSQAIARVSRSDLVHAAKLLGTANRVTLITEPSTSKP